jgi:ribosome biogenesis protein Tsr3
MKFKLDFTIYSSKERLEAIKQIDLSSLTKSELETVTNYVLYGKDDDGTSSVDRKEIQIKTKFNSYQKNRTVSLEGLMESPTFDENIFQKDRTIYKKKKISIKEF